MLKFLKKAGKPKTDLDNVPLPPESMIKPNNKPTPKEPEKKAFVTPYSPKEVPEPVTPKSNMSTLKAPKLPPEPPEPPASPVHTSKPAEMDSVKTNLEKTDVAKSSDDDPTLGDPFADVSGEYKSSKEDIENDSARKKPEASSPQELEQQATIPTQDPLPADIPASNGVVKLGDKTIALPEPPKLNDAPEDAQESSLPAKEPKSISEPEPTSEELEPPVHEFANVTKPYKEMKSDASKQNSIGPPAKPDESQGILSETDDFTLPDFDDLPEDMNGVMDEPKIVPLSEPVSTNHETVFIRAFDYLRLMEEKKKITVLLANAFEKCDEFINTSQQQQDVLEGWYTGLNLCQEKLIEMDKKLFER
ncbi:MAG: hypothetical protein KKG59_07775 [Nanoarchaeota archaeon]|nr:hypothetical protein [Nanoarchaeota archaeon]